jgi:hypothetical protein
MIVEFIFLSKFSIEIIKTVVCIVVSFLNFMGVKVFKYKVQFNLIPSRTRRSWKF